MNKSIEFLKERITNGDYTSLLKNIDFNKVITYNPLEVVKISNLKIGKQIVNNSISLCAEGDHKRIKRVRIVYNPDAQFDFFSQNFYVESSEKVSINKEINRSLDDIFKGLLFNKNTAPENYKDNDFWKYDVIYTIGDFVLNSEFRTDRDGNEKQYDILLLPMSIEYEINKNK